MRELYRSVQNRLLCEISLDPECPPMYELDEVQLKEVLQDINNVIFSLDKLAATIEEDINGRRQLKNKGVR